MSPTDGNSNRIRRCGTAHNEVSVFRRGLRGMRWGDVPWGQSTAGRRDDIRLSVAVLGRPGKGRLSILGEALGDGKDAPLVDQLDYSTT